MKVLNGFCMFNFRKLKLRFPSTLNDSSHMKCMFLLFCMFYDSKYIQVYLLLPLRFLSPPFFFTSIHDSVLSIALKFHLFLLLFHLVFMSLAMVKELTSSSPFANDNSTFRSRILDVDKLLTLSEL